MNRLIKSFSTSLVICSCTVAGADLAAAVPLVAQANQVNLEQEADQAYARGDAPRALFLYSRLLEQQPNNYTFQVRVAVALLNTGPENLAASYEAFQKASRLAPEIDESWLFLGQIDEAWERRQEAINHYGQALRLNPANQQAFIALQRIQAQPPLPQLPENLTTIESRNLDSYVARVETHSRRVQGLRAQLQIAEDLRWRALFPSVSLGFSPSRNSRFDSTSVSANTPTDFNDPLTFRDSSDRGRFGSFYVGVFWNITDLFDQDNETRIQSYRNNLGQNLQTLQQEAQRLYALRSNLFGEFRQLAWQAALNPTDRNIRLNRRDRYLQIFYVTQQIHTLTGIY